MSEGYRKIIQSHDAEMSAARGKAVAEAARRRSEVARAQAETETWFGDVFRPELNNANDAMRELRASLLVTSTQKVDGRARYRLEFRRHGRMSPPYMLMVGDGEFSVVQHTSAPNQPGVASSPPEVNDRSDVAPFQRLRMGAEDQQVPQIIETIIAESLRALG